MVIRHLRVFSKVSHLSYGGAAEFRIKRGKQLLLNDLHDMRKMRWDAGESAVLHGILR
jgi:hypothetical protein